MAPTMTRGERATVTMIRRICAAEIGAPTDYPFFGGASDAEVLAMFEAERPGHQTDRSAVLGMLFG